MGAERNEQATAAPATDEVVEAEIVDPGPEVEPASEEGDLISAELTAAQAELDEYRDTLQRLKAEFDNYKKRVVREQTALVERASAELIRELLPVLDALEAAVATDIEGDEGALKLKQGVDMTWSQLLSVLGNAGLERIAETGVAFDPERHEAVISEGGEERSGAGPVVEEVYRSGWVLKGRVVRPAMVKVRE